MGAKSAIGIGGNWKTNPFKQGNIVGRVRIKACLTKQALCLIAFCFNPLNQARDLALTERGNALRPSCVAAVDALNTAGDQMFNAKTGSYRGRYEFKSRACGLMSGSMTSRMNAC
jgi:hypothetical protein